MDEGRLRTGCRVPRRERRPVNHRSARALATGLDDLPDGLGDVAAGRRGVSDPGRLRGGLGGIAELQPGAAAVATLSARASGPRVLGAGGSA
eukprot:8544366-Alexandrium_andersonii.AAC.1